MKKIAFATAALSMLLTGAASAADLAARPYTKAPPIAAVYNWTGFYVGGHVGGAWTNEEWINTANTTTFGDLGPGLGIRQRGSGFIGGGHIGYNWQASNFVFGLEGSIDGLSNDHSVSVNTLFGAGDDVFSWRSQWMASIVGRAGVAFDNSLLYVKGGWAGVNNRLSVSDTVVNPAVGSGSQTTWHNGWTVGAGWEYGLTQNWIIGVEYNYAQFETKSYQLNNTQAGATYTFDAKPRDIQSVLGRLSYKFGGPIVARY